jgi:hypothetical protein
MGIADAREHIEFIRPQVLRPSVHDEFRTPVRGNEVARQLLIRDDRFDAVEIL